MGYIGETDQAILNYVEAFPIAIKPLMTLITLLGSPATGFIILLTALVYFYYRKARQLCMTVLFLLLAMPLSALLKELTRRVRPDNEYVQNMIFQTYSFPSGHAYSSMLVFGFLIYLVWKYLKSAWRWVIVLGLGVLILLIGISRVYLGAHFPSDVIGGWILSAVVLFLIIKIVPRYSKVNKSK